MALIEPFLQSPNEWVVAGGIFIATITLLYLFKYIILKKLEKAVKKTKTTLDDYLINIISKIGWPFYLVLALHITLAVSNIEIELINLSEIIYYALIIISGYYGIKILNSTIEYITAQISAEREAVGMTKTLLQIGVWVVIALVVLANLGYDTSALITGLGIGGIAVALAVQTILSDIFAYISIQFDKPFKVGDFIVVGSDMGTVEKIGIKSTRIRSVQGQELIISNKDLTNSRINNYGRMNKRRVFFNILVDGKTEVKKLKKIPQIIKKIIESIPETEFERAHLIRFAEYGILYEIVYYMLTPDYIKYLDTQQQINLKIKEAFEKEGITIPVPTQRVYVKRS